MYPYQKQQPSAAASSADVSSYQGAETGSTTGSMTGYSYNLYDTGTSSSVATAAYASAASASASFDSTAYGSAAYASAAYASASASYDSTAYGSAAYASAASPRKAFSTSPAAAYSSTASATTTYSTSPATAYSSTAHAPSDYSTSPAAAYSSRASAAVPAPTSKRIDRGQSSYMRDIEPQDNLLAAASDYYSNDHHGTSRESATAWSGRQSDLPIGPLPMDVGSDLELRKTEEAIRSLKTESKKLRLELEEQR